MFSKLFSRFQEPKTEHPLGSDENLNALMADIPQSNPGRLLFDIDELLAGMDACTAEIGPTLALRALARLDQFSRPAVLQMLTRYLSVGERDYLADSVWSALDIHAGHLFRGYQAFLNGPQDLKSDDDKLRIARCASRALMAWALRKKLQRFRYRTPGTDLWQDAHGLLQVSNRLGLLKTRVVPYRDEGISSPLNEYLIGLYLEFVPVGNVVPQQLEVAESFLRSCEDLDLSSQAHELSAYRINLEAALGPQRMKPDDPVGRSIRYCSVLKLRGAVMRFAAQAKKPPDDAPEWLSRVPASREQIESTVLILMTHWVHAPPSRHNDRAAMECDLCVVLGFGLARRLLAAAQYARMGRSFKYETDDHLRMFDEARFGSVAPEDEVAESLEVDDPVVAITPIELLHKLETDGDRAQMERWTQVDSSATGLGTVVPAVLPRHRIGLLICLREEDRMDWRLGLIRRIGRDATNRPSIGIETLAWPSICALAKPVGAEGVWSKVADGGHDWLDAIIVSQEGMELILPAGAFEAGMEVELRSEEGLWRVRLKSLLDRGPDYDRVEFNRIY